MLYLRLPVLFILVGVAGSLASAATHFAPNWNDMHTEHKWDSIPGKWESIGHPSVDSVIDLRIALKPDRESAWVDALYEVSNPNHPKYGAHLSREQVARLVAPHPNTIKLIESWLEHHGVPTSKVSTSHGGSWLTVTGVPMSKANDLLGASYQLFRHPESNETILRTVGYALPSALHLLVKMVAPTTYFGSPGTLKQTPRIHPSRAANVSSRNDDYHITPDFLRWLYKSREYLVAAPDRNVLGVTGFHGNYASYKDLTTFMSKYRSEAIDATFTVIEMDDFEYNPDDPSGEANLNMQYAQGIAWPTPHVFYSIGGLPEVYIPDSHQQEDNEPYLDWLNDMRGLESVPQTITISYGGNEQTFPRDYAETVCDLFGQLGLRGVSVLFASGNDGVGGGDCKKNDGSGVVQFQPMFPSSCPYVTSVGGTTLYPEVTTFHPEVAAIFSAGGFSNIFERPDYQTDAVNHFFGQLGDKHAGLYNKTSRGFPDIAALSDDFAPIFKDNLDIAEGTSCASPVAAGIISLLNDYRLSVKKPPLGFLNPWLYGSARLGFNDITFGSNPGCGTDGFAAIPGWDPVTGLGTPDFKKLQDILIHAPNPELPP